MEKRKSKFDRSSGTRSRIGRFYADIKIAHSAILIT